MASVIVLWRAWLRQRWPAAVALAVLVGLGTGIGLVATAAARRTASAYGRVMEAANAPDVISGHGRPVAEAAERRTLEGAAAAYTDVGFVGFVEGHDPVLIPYYIGAYDHPIATDRQLLVAGRYPDPEAAGEVLVTKDAAEEAGLSVGDEITVNFFTPDFDLQPERFTVTVTGVERRHVIGDAALKRNSARLTPAFTRSHLDLQVSSRTTFEASDAATLRRAVIEAGLPLDETSQADHDRAQGSVRPIVLSLAAIGAVALLATLLVCHQALAREHELRREERRTLAALGMAPARILAVDLLVLGAVVGIGLALAAGVAVALSPLAPVGRVRAIDPARGFDVDWTVLAGGLLGTGLVLGVAYVIGARLLGPRRAAGRDAGPVAVPTGVERLGPVPMAGLRMALGATPDVRRTFWTTAALTTMAMALIVAAVTFIGGLDRLTADPRRYGFSWDLAARTAYGAASLDDVVEEFTGDPAIEAIAASRLRNLVLDGKVTAPGMGNLAITGEFWPTVAEGRVPPTTTRSCWAGGRLDQLGVAIGDDVTLRAEQPSGSTAFDRVVKVVGRAVFAPVEVPGLDPPRLDTGVALDHGLLQALISESPSVAHFQESRSTGGTTPVDVYYFDLAKGADAGAVADRHRGGVPDANQAPTEWLLSIAPAEVLESNEALPLVRGALIPLGVVVVATVAHAQVAVVRRRRAEYAVLKTLGFTRRQCWAR